MFSKDLGIDLGTMFTRLADSTQVLSEEPTIVAIEVTDQKMVAVGQEARDMYGRVPESIEVARPLKNGVIADYEITETLAFLSSPARQRIDAHLSAACHDHCSIRGDQRGAPRGL